MTTSKLLAALLLVALPYMVQAQVTAQNWHQVLSNMGARQEMENQQLQQRNAKMLREELAIEQQQAWARAHMTYRWIDTHQYAGD